MRAKCGYRLWGRARAHLTRNPPCVSDRSTAISWGYESAAPSHSQFIDYNQMQGTRDFSAFLTVPKAIEFLNENNWQQVAANCRELAHSNYVRFCDLLNTQPLCPVTDEFLGQMCSMLIKTSEPQKLQRLLYEKYKI